VTCGRTEGACCVVPAAAAAHAAATGAVQVPQVQRMLLGLCRRKGLRVLATAALGGADAAAVQPAVFEAAQAAAQAAVAAAAAEEGDGHAPPWLSASAPATLLSWSVAREVVRSCLPLCIPACARLTQPLLTARWLRPPRS
jgi:hypothetical protein